MRIGNVIIPIVTGKTRYFVRSEDYGIDKYTLCDKCYEVRSASVYRYIKRTVADLYALALADANNGEQWEAHTNRCDLCKTIILDVIIPDVE